MKQAQNGIATEVVGGTDLPAGYAAMAADKVRESEARAWIEGLVADVADEPGRPADRAP